MKKRIIAFLLCLIIIFTFVACADNQNNSVKTIEDLYKLESLKDVPKEQSEATPLFWKVTDSSGGVVYLFGSIHVADKSYLRLSDKIMQAYLDCDALAVEINMVEINNNYFKAMAIAQMSIYSDGTNLDDHITKSLADEYLNFLKGYPEFLAKQGITDENIEILRTFKPAFLAGLASSIAIEETGLSSELGVDMLFLNTATEMKKEILEIETAAFQANLLYNVPDILGKRMIMDAMAVPVPVIATSLMELYAAWKVGDLDYFELMLQLEADIEESGYTEEEIIAYLNYNKAMNDDRNVVMANTVESYLSSKKSVFVVVGEAHMVGENGIVNLLANKGYTVELISGNASLFKNTVAA